MHSRSAQERVKYKEYLNRTQGFASENSQVIEMATKNATQRHQKMSINSTTSSAFKVDSQHNSNILAAVHALSIPQACPKRPLVPRPPASSPGSPAIFVRWASGARSQGNSPMGKTPSLQISSASTGNPNFIKESLCVSERELRLLKRYIYSKPRKTTQLLSKSRPYKREEGKTLLK